MTTKSNVLQALLGANKNVTQDIAIRRLGVNFTVKALDESEITQINSECTFSDGKGGKRVDDKLVNASMIAKSCAEPNFADAALIAHYGATDAADCVKKALLAGEIAKLVEGILRISGFGDDEIDFPN